ncbi:MAG: hypothetical protein WDZ40_02435 [Candidatus Spechtbacterales bacterium]
MTTIKTTCDNCRNVEILVKEMKGIVQNPETGNGFYIFLCVECDTHQKNPANKEVIAVLSALGISITLELTEKEIDNFSVQLDKLEDVVGAMEAAKKEK